MMMMSRSRTRLLLKKSSIKGGTKRAAKRSSICSSFFSFVLFNKMSLLLMILSAIMMSENFAFSPVGVEGKKQQHQKSSSSSSFEAFQNERQEKRGTLGLCSIFLSHSVFLVFFSRSRVRIVCVCYALQSTTVNEFKTPFCFFLLQHSLITHVNVHIFLLCYILYFNNQNNHLIHNKRKQKNDES